MSPIDWGILREREDRQREESGRHTCSRCRAYTDHGRDHLPAERLPAIVRDALLDPSRPRPQTMAEAYPIAGYILERFEEQCGYVRGGAHDVWAGLNEEMGLVEGLDYRLPEWRGSEQERDDRRQRGVVAWQIVVSSLYCIVLGEARRAVVQRAVEEEVDDFAFLPMRADGEPGWALDAIADKMGMTTRSARPRVIAAIEAGALEVEEQPIEGRGGSPPKVVLAGCGEE